MVKSELIESLAERADITLAKAEEVVDLFFNGVTDTLAQGNRVEIRGFGAFTVREYKSYTGRNPKTGEQITVPPKRLPFWKTGQELKQRVDSAFLSRDAQGGEPGNLLQASLLSKPFGTSFSEVRLEKSKSTP